MPTPDVAATLVPFLSGLAITLLAGPLFLPLMRRWKWGQAVRSQGPSTHMGKAGTPTMGGLLFIAGTSLAAWLAAPGEALLSVALFTFLGFGLLGFIDDYIKVALRRPLGLKARYKLLGQLALSAFLAWSVASVPGGTEVWLPFTGLTVDLGVLYIPFAIVAILGTANGANLTDGLDGLLAGATVFAGLAYTFISLGAGRPEMAVFAAALAGACLGFLRYNAHPARVFMGDTGSLAIGGALAALALLTKTELLLPLVGGLLVIEVLSVIVQVTVFRLWRRRVLRMSPLHHHFELSGWSEVQVVRRFWVLAALFAALGLLGTYGLLWVVQG